MIELWKWVEIDQQQPNPQINVHPIMDGRLVRVVSEAAPGRFYECEITSKSGQIMVLQPEEILKFPNGKRKLSEFLSKDTVSVVRCQPWASRSFGPGVEVMLENGVRKVIPRTLVPGAPKSGAKKPISMERWDVKMVKARYRFRANDFQATFYYVEWEEPSAQGEWIHEKQMCFEPGPRVKDWRESMAVPPPPLAPCGIVLATAEWEVFKKYFLPQVQQLIREGWRTTKSISGRVRQGAAFPCTPAVRDRLFLHSKKAVLTKGAQLNHYTFYSAADLPDVLVGSSTKEPWWMYSRSSELAEGDTLQVLFAVIGDVTLHYSPAKHRMAISFDYVVLQASTKNIAWTRIHGSPLPNSWLFLDPADLRARITSKDRPYRTYFTAEELNGGPFSEDAVSVAESEEGAND